MVKRRRSARGQGNFTGVWTDARPLRRSGGFKECERGDIKSAYRKLAKKLHPDANKHDPKAASRFAELNAAYEIVGDDDKRKAFDRGEIDAEGKPRFQGFEGSARNRAAVSIRAAARISRASVSVPTASSAPAAAVVAAAGSVAGSRIFCAACSAAPRG